MRNIPALYSSLIISHSSSEPGPDRLARRGQRRQVAEIAIALAHAVEVRAGRGEQPVFVCALRPVAVLVGGVAAGDDFDADAAQVAKRAEELRALGFVEL